MFGQRERKREKERERESNCHTRFKCEGGREYPR